VIATSVIPSVLKGIAQPERFLQRLSRWCQLGGHEGHLAKPDLIGHVMTIAVAVAGAQNGLG
jgi:hypothetical protein